MDKLARTCPSPPFPKGGPGGISAAGYDVYVAKSPSLPLWKRGKAPQSERIKVRAAHPTGLIYAP